MPRLPLRPHGCLSRRVVCHGHPFLLKGSHLGCWKVGLSEAEPGVPSCPQRAPGQHTSPAHPDPTAAAHHRGPCHCHQGTMGAKSQARGWCGSLHGILCVHPSPAHGPAGAAGSVCARQVHTGRLPSTAGPGSHGAPVGGLGRTSDHHRGLVNFPPVPSASSAPMIIPPLRGPLMPGLLCSPQTCSRHVMPGQSLMTGCILGSPGFLSALPVGTGVPHGCELECWFQAGSVCLGDRRAPQEGVSGTGWASPPPSPDRRQDHPHSSSRSWKTGALSGSPERVISREP